MSTTIRQIVKSAAAAIITSAIATVGMMAIIATPTSDVTTPMPSGQVVVEGSKNDVHFGAVMNDEPSEIILDMGNTPITDEFAAAAEEKGIDFFSIGEAEIITGEPRGVNIEVDQTQSEEDFEQGQQNGIYYASIGEADVIMDVTQ